MQTTKLVNAEKKGAFFMISIPINSIPKVETQGGEKKLH